MGGHRSSGVFSYSDLTSYCCDISSRTENVEDDALLRKLIQGLGPEGLGLVVVKDVPGMLDLQQKLLPLAREITLLDERDRKLVLKDMLAAHQALKARLGKVVSTLTVAALMHTMLKSQPAQW
eukprot:jgi/Mesen1/6219/ME000320S05414